MNPVLQWFRLSPEDSPSTASPAMAHEVAKTLARRVRLSVLTYPVLVAVAVLTFPGGRSRLVFNLPWVLILLITGIRFRACAAFDRLYPLDPVRWRRMFRLGALASVATWDMLAIQEMNAGGDGWPTWMMLVMTAGIGSGCTTSLCPDPPLLRWVVVSLLTPQIVWALHRGGADGAAIALVVSAFLVFIQIQGNHNAKVFWHSARDKEALREAGQRLESLVNSIDGVVWESDLQRSRFSFVGRQAEAILGYPVDSWLLEPAFWKDRLYPPDRDAAVRFCAAESAAGGNYTFEYRMVAADGRIVWLRDIVRVAVNDAGEAALRGVMVDVTAHKQANEERNLLAQALRTVTESVAIVDLDERIIFANDSFLRLYGYAREEVLSKSISLTFSPRVTPEVAASITEGTRRGGWQGLLWNRDRAGREFPVSLSTALVRDELGRTVAVIGVGSDFSEQKRAQDELLRAKEAAEAANHAKSEFLANMSHEIRTPLNGVVGMSQLLLNTKLDLQQRRYAETVQNSATSLLSVLNDILDFSKIEARKLTMEMVDFDLCPILEMISDLFAVGAQEKGLEFCCFIEPEVPTALRGDPARLRQALMNLAGNAVKFTSAGSVSIRVKLEQGGDPAMLRFEVRDTGIGIHPAKRNLLFQPFSQADSSTTRNFGGTGLGLSIARRLVELMGGSIGVESEEGAGSTFWFTALFERQAGVVRPKPLSLRSHCVLVLDHCAESRRVLHELLSSWGCDFEQAVDLRQAGHIARTSGRPVEALLVSADLPELPNFWASEIASIPAIALVPLSRLSGCDWQALGFAAAITKPIKQGELEAVLARMLGVGEKSGSAGREAGDALKGGLPSDAVARLLVVEDNVTNQEVVIGMLRLLGCESIDVAVDGRSGLELLARADFDLVFMDCHLPEIDGYEATRLLRQGSANGRNRQTPVVAMTAGAMAGDRAKCLESGMDDYMVKPISVNALRQMLEKWLRRESATLAGGAAISAPATTAPPVFDWEDLLERTMGNEDLARTVVASFLRDMPPQLAALADAVKRSDPPALRLAAHTIKGAASNAGAVKLSLMAKAMERAGLEGNVEGTSELIVEMGQQWEQYRESAMIL